MDMIYMQCRRKYRYEVTHVYIFGRKIGLLLFLFFTFHVFAFMIGKLTIGLFLLFGKHRDSRTKILLEIKMTNTGLIFFVCFGRLQTIYHFYFARKDLNIFKRQKAEVRKIFITKQPIVATFYAYLKYFYILWFIVWTFSVEKHDESASTWR